ncbi:hypothetical protein [Novosphingobium sp. PC22D]|uniref:hypothetical protein n=1 Tax=Novosphingobium sp. PC22D TaxID=1962403 RepID=UPI00197E82E1|nr:hypothetical protein [Novosphingobium sp. PC22D]
MGKPPKRPRDPNQLAKLMVDIAAGEEEDEKLSAKKNARQRAARSVGKPARAL